MVDNKTLDTRCDYTWDEYLDYSPNKNNQEFYLKVIKCLYLNKKDGYSSKIMNIAAKRGHLKIIKYLHFYYKNTYSTVVMDNAATGGYIDIIKWLYDNRIEGCSEYAFQIASSNRFLEVVEFLYFNRSDTILVNYQNSIYLGIIMDIALSRIQDTGCINPDTSSKRKNDILILLMCTSGIVTSFF